MRALSKSMAGVVTLAMAGGLVLGASGIANAAPYSPASPPYPADSNNVASLTIFDATTGAVVRSGSTSTPLSSYYFVSSSDFNPGKTKAALSGYLAEAGKAPGAFSGTGLGAASAYPATTAPSPVNSVTTPTAKGGSTSSFGSLAGSYPNNAPAGDPFFHLYQLRVNTTFPTPASATYAFADVQIDPAAGTWQQVAPTTSTAPIPPATPGQPTATAGDTTADVTVPAASGASSYTVTAAPGGATLTGAGPLFHFTGLTNGTAYTFTATATNANGTSPASPASAAVTPAHPADPSSTALAVTSGGPYVSNHYTFTATVSSAGAPGQVNNGAVDFFDNGSTTPLGTVSGTSAGSYVLSDVTLPAGSHSVVAKYSPTNPALITPSTSPAQAFTTAADPQGACTDPSSVCRDVANIQTVVPVGTLVINTPYTSALPLVLPTMSLNPAGDQLSTSAAFEDIKVTDTRSGDLPWTVKALASNLTNGTGHANGVINGQNVGLTALTVKSMTGSFVGAVVPSNNPAADPAVAPLASGGLGLGGSTDHVVANTDNGRGTVVLHGLLTINAPTSTENGTYNGTVVFTVG